MNLPNKLTVFRIILVPIMIFVWLFPYEQFNFMFYEFNFGPVSLSSLNIVVLVIFALASITDMLDGIAFKYFETRKVVFDAQKALEILEKIVGEADKNALEFLNTLASELGCCNYEFLGFRKDVYELMQRSEIFCLSSRVEGLPMALIEAMNAGCCCVSFE